MTIHVDSSVTSARWRLAPVDDRRVMDLHQKTQVPELLARLLAARDIPVDQVNSFLYPTLARDFPDPFRLKGMREAATDVADRVIAGQTMGIFADFDVDGATSSALLVQFFRALGVPMQVHIPDRLVEGYGPNAPALLGLQAKGASIAIICDCGITAIDVLAEVDNQGFPVIVLDHHEPEATLPAAAHIINPKLPDDISGYRMLAAVGVTFLFCVAVNNVLRERGVYTPTQPEPPLKSWLDLVALGTLCDMVPLTGPNRVLVRAGMQMLDQRQNVGIQALCQVAKIDPSEKITPTHCGFALGPRINAGGRVHESNLGMRLLSSTDPAEALRLAEILDDCNLKRREMETSTYKQALQKVEQLGLDRDPVIVVDDLEWHPGLAGLVAGRLKEKYNRPVCVVTYTKMGDGRVEGRGSGRSVPGFNIAALFQAARAAGLLVKGGGHAMAGGFTVLPEQLPVFRVFIRDHAAEIAGGDLVREYLGDSLAFVRTLQLNVARVLEENLGPYGPDHAEPLFILPQVRVATADIIGSNHVRARLTDWEGGPQVKAMAFRAAETPVGQAILQARDEPLHLLGTLRIDRWQGRETPVFFVQDAARVATDDMGAIRVA